MDKEIYERMRGLALQNELSGLKRLVQDLKNEGFTSKNIRNFILKEGFKR